MQFSSPKWSVIFGLLMLLVAGSRLTDFDYLAERYQSLISAVPNAVRSTLYKGH